MNRGPGDHEGPPDDPTDLSRRDFLRRGAAPVVAFIALEAHRRLGPRDRTSPKRDEVQPGCRLSRPIPLYRMPHLRSHLLTGTQAAGPVGRAAHSHLNDPTTKVADVIKQAYPDRGEFHQEPCLQCPTAECLYVCPVDALVVEPRTGARYIGEDVCVSCGRCNEACPFPITPESQATNQLTLEADLTHHV